MRKFKLRTGVSNPYEINVDSACDNPIQLIGLYKRLENTDRPYGKHYNRSLFFAPYNETAYCFCPYSSDTLLYVAMDRFSIKVDSYYFGNLINYSDWNPRQKVLHIAERYMNP